MNTFFAYILFMFKHIKYEIVYYMLGAYAVYEDMLYCRKNKCELITKSGKIAVITGGARGLGAVMVKKLLQCDMHVIIGCRNSNAGKTLIEKIRKEYSIESGNATILTVDMSSLKSIKLFAENIMKQTNVIHILINNAGIMFTPYTETEDGYESQWGVNYVGHYYLTHLLLNCLIKGGQKCNNDSNCSSANSNNNDVLFDNSSDEGNSRIINVTSCAHFAGCPIDFNDINMKNCYIPSSAYAQSKLAQLMFTKALDRKLKERQIIQGGQPGCNVRTIAVHPGVVDTDIFNDTLFKTLLPWVIKLFFKTPEQGVTSILYSAISPRLDNEGGTYISNCRKTANSKTADDLFQQEKLFKHTAESLGINEFGVV